MPKRFQKNSILKKISLWNERYTIFRESIISRSQ